MHFCHTPGEALIARQCHIQPDLSAASPVFDVVLPYLERLVDFLVASFSKVVIMSEAWQKQSSPALMYCSCFLHSAHAADFDDSTCPGAEERLVRSDAASVPARSAKPTTTAAIVHFIGLKKRVLKVIGWCKSNNLS